MKRKMAVGILLTVVVITILVLIFIKKDSEFDISIEDITSVSIINGNNGVIKNITDEKILIDICDKISDLRGKKNNSEAATGWLYRIEFYNGNDFLKKITFISSDYIEVNGKTYSVDGEECVKMLNQI